MNRLYAILLVFITLLSFHCQKEVNVDLPGTPGSDLTDPDPVTATVQGNILDENGQPAAGVIIKAGNKNAVTDAKGYFRIINAPLDKNASLVTAEKPGYFKAYRSFSATSAANQVAIKLIKKRLAGIISATGGEVTVVNEAKLALPANAVVKAAGGSYGGDIKVYAAYIDPTAADIGTTVPGSFMADNSDNQRVTLASYGMMAVELESATGEKLQIAQDKQATLTVPIPSSIRSSAPATIALWYIDEQTGLWKEEGKATRSGNNYVGEVKHFSFWNCDVGLQAVMLKLSLKNGEGLPLVHTTVLIRGIMNATSAVAYGFTDSLGTVSGLVLSNQTLTLEVLSTDCINNVIYSTTIGPLSAPTDLGVITVTGVSDGLVTIKGKLVNCNGQPVTAGTALIHNGYGSSYVSANQDGEFALVYVRCDNSSPTLTIIGLDKNTQEESDPVSIPFASPVANAGTITACGTASAQFISYKVDGVEYEFNNTNAPDSLIGFTFLEQQPSPHYTTLFTASNFNELKWIDLRFQSAQPAAGTYPITELAVNQYGTVNVVSPSTVTITQFPLSAGSFFEGNFTGQFRDSVNQDPVHMISGSFRLRRQ